MTRSTTLYSENTPYSITVMMPYADYSGLETKNTVQLILIILILGFAVLSLSLYFSKRFILPIKKSLDKIKQSEKTYSDESQSGIMEIDDLFAFLAEKDNEYQKIFDEHSEKNESLQSEIERIRTENKRRMIMITSVRVYAALLPRREQYLTSIWREKPFLKFYRLQKLKRVHLNTITAIFTASSAFPQKSSFLILRHCMHGKNNNRATQQRIILGCVVLS